MRIGELSKRTGVSVQAIRLYERRRLLKKPPRTPAGYRVYSEQYVDMVSLIQQGKRFGFSLREISKVLALFAVPDEASGTTRFQPGEQACVVEILRIGGKKLEELNAQIESLRRKHKELTRALNELRRPRPPARKTTRS